MKSIRIILLSIVACMPIAAVPYKKPVAVNKVASTQKKVPAPNAFQKFLHSVEYYSHQHEVRIGGLVAIVTAFGLGSVGWYKYSKKTGSNKTDLREDQPEKPASKSIESQESEEQENEEECDQLDTEGDHIEKDTQTLKTEPEQLPAPEVPKQEQHTEEKKEIKEPITSEQPAEKKVSREQKLRQQLALLEQEISERKIAVMEKEIVDLQAIAEQEKKLKIIEEKIALEEARIAEQKKRLKSKQVVPSYKGKSTPIRYQSTNEVPQILRDQPKPIESATQEEKDEAKKVMISAQDGSCDPLLVKKALDTVFRGAIDDDAGQWVGIEQSGQEFTTVQDIMKQIVQHYTIRRCLKNGMFTVEKKNKAEDTKE